MNACIDAQINIQNIVDSNIDRTEKIKLIKKHLCK